MICGICSYRATRDRARGQAPGAKKPLPNPEGEVDHLNQRALRTMNPRRDAARSAERGQGDWRQGTGDTEKAPHDLRAQGGEFLPVGAFFEPPVARAARRRHRGQAAVGGEWLQRSDRR
jgi:hypothetical protein